MSSASTPSLSSSRYFLSFTDDFSRISWIYFLKTKNQVFENFKEWKLMIEKQTDKKVKYLRTDNGLEFCGELFNNFCRQSGITRHKTVTYTPQQNRVAERLNKTIMERVRCLLSDVILKEKFWAEAAAYVMHTLNRSPHTSLGLLTPEKK